MIKKGTIIEGEFLSNSNGSAYVVNESLHFDVFIDKKNTEKALHEDRVRVEVIKTKYDFVEGKIINVLERFKNKFVGTLEVNENFAFLIPDSKKIKRDFFIPLDKLNGGKDGQKAVIEMISWESGKKNPKGFVVEILGEKGDNDAEIHSILHEYNLPYNFDDKVEEEANLIPLFPTEEDISKRKDLRDVLTFTIDPIDAKDFDDALSFETVSDNFRIGIHIADVSYYVNPGSELDKEAYKRGTSIYLVDRVVPMLPERLSNGVCSLRPNEDKMCFSAIFTINKEGKLINEWFGKTTIHSDYRLSYEDAQSIIENKSSEINTNSNSIYNNLKDAILNLDSLAKKLRIKRDSVSLESQEVKFKLDENGKPIDIIFKISKDSNKLIEEFMLLANKRVAHFLNKKMIDIPNRVHANPDLIKLENLKLFVKQFGYNLDISNSIKIKDSLNQITLDSKGTSEENIINNLVIRTMQKAEYSTDNIGHYGLGFEDYAHFTSPIRRYPDVILHRILDEILKGNKNNLENNLDDKCKHLSKKEVIAQKASRDSIKFKQTEFMLDKVGKIYTGIVTSVVNYGLYIEIEETKCEGLVRISEINGDFFEYDEKNYCVKGFNTGEIIRLGDLVSVYVKNVDIEKRNIDLNLIKL